jgi:putative SOS response-associated peptidase YedK
MCAPFPDVVSACLHSIAPAQLERRSDPGRPHHRGAGGRRLRGSPVIGRPLGSGSVLGKDIKIGSKLINARSESILDKPSFRKAAVKRRALVRAEGYYEWQKTEDGKKIPNYLYSEKENVLACTVLTRTAHDSLGHVHDRAPVIIPPSMYAQWLDPDMTDKEKVHEMLDAIPEPVLTPRVVTERVNSVRNNGPELIELAT